MNLTINDLNAVVEIIDVVTQRGAIKGDELLAVGTIRNKIAEFIQSQLEEHDSEDQQESD
jgi:hypothetical protein